MERTCETCGAQFEVWPSVVKKGGGKFCSSTCYGTHQAAHPHGGSGSPPAPAVEKVCEQCGAIYKTSERRPKRYCSAACRTEATSVEKVCEQCGRTFRVARSNVDRYRVCSIECRQAATTYKRCDRCGDIFTDSIGNRSHCSEECRRPPVTIDCLHCGKTVRIVPATRKRFCTVRCYMAYDGETIPEQNVRLSLSALGVTFEQEGRIEGLSTRRKKGVDFLLPELRIALEVDDPYWHAKTGARDARKTLFLQQRGWTVLRMSTGPFYGPHAESMVDVVRAALAIAQEAVPVSDVAGLHPFELAFPLDQERVVSGGGDS